MVIFTKKVWCNAVFYKNELDFLRNTYKKCNLQTLILDINENMDPHIDLMFRKNIGGEDLYKKEYFLNLNELEQNTIYRFADSFNMNYILLRLPNQQKIFSIGPYLSADISEQRVLEIAENNKIPSLYLKQIEQFYASVPIISEQNRIFAMLDCFAELIFGGAENFTVVDLTPDIVGERAPLTAYNLSTEHNSIVDMQMMEQRYNYENEIIRAVSLGQTHKAEQILNNFSQLSFERRLSDPLRNMKNYCIIMNTILRKAAEQGGVHPIYINRISSDYAIKIEQLPSIAAVQSLMGEMFSGYCRLVKKYATKNYSQIVQKTVIYIESELCNDLSLSTIAKIHNVSASYLSTQFKKETGSTLTEFVNKKRIKYAMYLLKSTNLQVQTVAQHCGILDMQYFSKLFKKHTGKTPKEFRASN